MKKLHILILSLVATASMPLIGLVACNPEEANVIHIDKWTEPILSSGQVTIDENVKYKVIIDLAKCNSSFFTGSYSLTCAAGTLDPLSTTFEHWSLNGNDITSQVSCYGFGTWEFVIGLKRSDNLYYEFVLNGQQTTSFHFQPIFLTTSEL